MQQAAERVTNQVAGPIVRINPKELSIADASFYDKVYVSGSTRRTQGYSQFASGIGFEGKVSWQIDRAVQNHQN